MFALTRRIDGALRGELDVSAYAGRTVHLRFSLCIDADFADLFKGILDAAERFEHCRLPELFGGFARDYGAPVPYHKANLPQTWSAATPLLAVRLLLGIVPDAPQGRCYFLPHLPDWLPALDVENIRVGPGSFDLSLRRDGEDTVVVDLRSDGIDLIRAEPEAPLWGKPMTVTG